MHQFARSHHLLYIAVLCMQGCSNTHPVSSAPAMEPLAIFPEQINLGNRERGEVAVAEFIMANGGGSTLVVDQFESNCSCGGIERQRDGQYVRIEELKLEPHEQIALRIRISVRGVPIGARASNAVKFHTNDPNKPYAQIEGVIPVVTGGVYVVPENITFGLVQVGAVVSKIVDVRDDALVPRKLDYVTSSNDKIKARLLKPAENSPIITRSIAQIELSIDTSSPGNIDGAISLHLANNERSPDNVPVICKVVEPFDVVPSKLVLPRCSGNETFYSVNCFIRCTSGQPLTVSVESCPDHLTATIDNSIVPPASSIHITVTLKRSSELRPKNLTEAPIRLRCRTSDIESVCELPVVIVSEQR